MIEKFPFHRVRVQNRFSEVGIPENHIILCCEITYDNNLSRGEKESLEKLSLEALKGIDLINDILLRLKVSM